MKPLIAFDLDETLCNLRDSVANAFSKHDMHLPPKDWKQYDFKSVYGVDIQLSIEIMLDQRCIEDCEPEPGAAKLLHALQENYDVEIWTARGWHPQAKEATETWLKQHGFPQIPLRIVPIDGSKAIFAEKEQRLVAFIDDLPGHLDSIKKVAPHVGVALVSRPWNLSRTDLPRAIDAMGALKLALPEVLLVEEKLKRDAKKKLANKALLS